jgi:DNA-binding Lrp family transcriptional regulator
MPLYKVSYKERRMIVEIKDECPCITNAAIARIFRISQSRVGEIIREEEARKQREEGDSV